MVIKDMTVPELNYYRDNCNFVGNEIEVFEYRSQGVSLERIAEYVGLTYDGVKYVSRKINSKIERVQ